MTLFSRNRPFVRRQPSNAAVMAAVSVLFTAICGYLYCGHLQDFFSILYGGRLQHESTLSPESLSLLLHYLSAVLMIYFITMTVLACLIILHRRRQVQAVLFLMAALKLTAFLLMLSGGASFTFHNGLEYPIEAILLVHIARLPQTADTTEERLTHLNAAVLAGIVVELVPLLRNIQCLPAAGMNFWGKAALILLPPVMMFSFFALGLYRLHAVRRPHRHPAPIVRLVPDHSSPTAVIDRTPNRSIG